MSRDRMLDRVERWLAGTGISLTTMPDPYGVCSAPLAPWIATGWSDWLDHPPPGHPERLGPG